MTIYQHCANAIRDLMKTGQPFTDLDAVQRASQVQWSAADFKKALLRSNQIAQAFYKDGKLFRYGPVNFQGTEDYARFAARIVHAGPTGPDVLITPNGNFPRLATGDDEIASAGRRRGTNRDDKRPWPKDDVETKLNEALKRIADLEKSQDSLAKALGD
jgi:hypothetical protein